MKTVAIRASVITAFAVAAAACGPVGNDLFLAGSYSGTLQIDMNGTFDDGTETDVDLVSEDDMTLTIEKAYDADALLTGLDCAVALKAEDGKLVSVEDVTCKQDQTITANDTDTAKTRETTMANVVIESKGNGEITVDAEIDSTLEEKVGDADPSVTRLEGALQFEGTRVAGE